jgi:hypothetical protein
MTNAANLPTSGLHPVADFPSLECILVGKQAEGRTVVGYGEGIEQPRPARDVAGIRFVTPFECGGMEWIRGSWYRVLSADGTGHSQTRSLTCYVLR